MISCSGITRRVYVTSHRAIGHYARRDLGGVVGVASNVAHANTAALARKVTDVFAGQK